MAKENSLQWYLGLIVVIYVAKISEGSLTAKVRCDDNAKAIYIDGEIVGSTSYYKTVWEGTVSDTAKLIAVDCLDTGGNAAIIASVSNGFVSDETWKCSGTSVSGWYDIGFNDSEWETAYVIETLKDGRPFPKDGRFPDDAKWIWKDEFFYPDPKTHSYCRGYIECGCEYKCNVTGDTFTCLCQEGHVLNTDDRTCRDVDECNEAQADNPAVPLHKCEQTTSECVNVPGSYECKCREGGYTPDDDDWRRCNDIDECATGNHNCFGLSKCTNTMGSFDCVCPTGFRKVETRDVVDCGDDDECERENGGCEQNCTNTVGSYMCSCDGGFELQSDAKTCACPSGHSSVTESNSIPRCVDDDECKTENGGCEQNCTNTVGSYMCSCDGGFKLQSDAKTCACPSGHSSVTESNSIPRCVDDDECKTENGGCEQNCINTVGSYICLCDGGSELQDDAKTCAKLGRSCSETYSSGFIASIIVNVLVILLVVIGLGIIIFRRRYVMRREAMTQNSNNGNLELAHGAENAIGQSSAHKKREDQHKYAVSKSDDAINSDYEKVDSLGTGPYESLEQTAQYANSSVSPYEALH